MRSAVTHCQNRSLRISGAPETAVPTQVHVILGLLLVVGHAPLDDEEPLLWSARKHLASA